MKIKLGLLTFILLISSPAMTSAQDTEGDAERVRLRTEMFKLLEPVAKKCGGDAESALNWLKGISPLTMHGETLTLLNQEDQKTSAVIFMVIPKDASNFSIGDFVNSGEMVMRIMPKGGVRVPIMVVNSRAECSPTLRALMILQAAHSVRKETEGTLLSDAIFEGYTFLVKSLDAVGGEPYRAFVLTSYTKLVEERKAANLEPGRFIPPIPYSEGHEKLEETFGKPVGLLEKQMRLTYSIVAAVFRDIDENLPGDAAAKAARKKEFIMKLTTLAGGE